MIAAILAASAVLITQTYDGKFTITEAPSMHACEEAKCVALDGAPCVEAAKAKAEMEEARRRMQAERDAQYVAANPKLVAQCKAKKSPYPNDCATRSGVMMSVYGYAHEGWGGSISSGVIGQAWCAQ